MTAIRFIVAVALLAGIMGQGCPAPSAVVEQPDPPQQQTQQEPDPQDDEAPSVCSAAQYYDPNYRWGFSPIPFSTGPVLDEIPQFGYALKWEKRLTSLVILTVIVSHEGMASTIDEWRAARLASLNNHVVITDEFFSLYSGRRAWFVETSSDGVQNSAVHTVKDGRVYMMDVYWSPGIPAGDAGTLFAALDSFCVD